MLHYSSAIDLLDIGETAVTVFTCGDYLYVDSNGNGRSGMWVKYARIG